MVVEAPQSDHAGIGLTGLLYTINKPIKTICVVVEMSSDDL